MCADVGVRSAATSQPWISALVHDLARFGDKGAVGGHIAALCKPLLPGGSLAGIALCRQNGEGSSAVVCAPTHSSCPNGGVHETQKDAFVPEMPSECGQKGLCAQFLHRPAAHATQLMGGPGSGRRPYKASVDDCRLLDIGELCDGGAAEAFPRGEILWKVKYSGTPLALLVYRIARQQHSQRPPSLLVAYLYWRNLLVAPQGAEIELVGGQGARISALCPGWGCGRPARKLYLPPGDDLLLCRCCHGLTYPPSPKARNLRLMREILAPLLAEIEAASKPGEPPPEEDGPGYRGPQESRLACLRLRACGLSLRQIAPRVGISKSSVGRYLHDGADGIDAFELYRERQMEAHLESLAALGGASVSFGALGQELREIHRLAARFDLYRHNATENEVRVLLREAAGKQDREHLLRPADHERCFEALREQGFRRLLQEAKAWRRKRRQR